MTKPPKGFSGGSSGQPGYRGFTGSKKSISDFVDAALPPKKEEKRLAIKRPGFTLQSRFIKEVIVKDGVTTVVLGVKGIDKKVKIERQSPDFTSYESLDDLIVTPDDVLSYNNSKSIMRNDLYHKFKNYVLDQGLDKDHKISSVISGFEKSLKSSKDTTPSTSQLPEKAPVLWTGNHHPDDTPATFIMREYAQYMGKGLTTGTIRKLDPTLASLYSAWKNPKEGQPPELPTGFNLPSKRQAIDERDKELTPEVIAGASRTSSRAFRKNQRTKNQAQDR